MSDAITIRRPRSPGDYLALQDVQRQAWHLTDERYVVPVATLIGADRHGGVVLGAFRDDDRAVGLSFAFLARIRGRLGLYSQLTGVVPDYRGQGIGNRLKQAQRTLARVQQLPVIAWAFDPLQARNAWFNFRGLGARGIAHEYVVDMYGPRTDALNAGTPTDRLILEWEVDGPGHRLPRVLLARDAPRLIAAQGAHGPAFSGLVPSQEPAVLIEIPPDILTIRAHQPELARGWQMAVRAAFQTAFATGYVATAVLRGLIDPDDFHYVMQPASALSEPTPTVISGPDNRDDLRRA